MVILSNIQDHFGNIQDQLGITLVISRISLLAAIFGHIGVFKPNFSDLLPFFIRQTPNLSDTYSEWINRLQLIKSVGNVLSANRITVGARGQGL